MLAAWVAIHLRGKVVKTAEVYQVNVANVFIMKIIKTEFVSLRDQHHQHTGSVNLCRLIAQEKRKHKAEPDMRTRSTKE